MGKIFENAIFYSTKHTITFSYTCSRKRLVYTGSWNSIGVVLLYSIQLIQGNLPFYKSTDLHIVKREIILSIF